METFDENDKLKSLIIEETKYHTRLTKKFENRIPWQPKDTKKLFTVIPGNISKICVDKGAKVKKGEDILILEAMKMKNHIISPKAGKIKTIFVEAGQNVARNDLLVEFEK
ncbi:MAG: acetyl-CoA carboxylase biotin carboxyl carrier protein subunit [Bacteroidia bacterium]|nr:acetyl-CoA carboxylase biotin carboxyl carrier protein subunit [Bacteroidia bacterium]